eukprot:Filipodium_phascolosomae@DN1399_c0_g2_i1.p1
MTAFCLTSMSSPSNRPIQISDNSSRKKMRLSFGDEESTNCLVAAPMKLCDATNARFKSELQFQRRKWPKSGAGSSAKRSIAHTGRIPSKGILPNNGNSCTAEAGQPVTDNRYLRCVVPEPAAWAVVEHCVGKRKCMEDRHVVLTNLSSEKNNKTLSYFAVFDGHGGANAADYAAQQMHRKIINNRAVETDPCSALKASFLDLDREYLFDSL